MTVRNLKIDQVTGDLVLAAGNLALVSDLEAIEQAVNSNLRAFLGEWFLDNPDAPKIGLPYYQKVLVKNPDPAVLRSVFRRVILGTVGISDATLTDLRYDKASRTLAVAWRGISDSGQFVSGSPTLQTP